MKKVCVIGGGAAGLMAAYAAAQKGHQVILLEKNEKLGKKIYITGKGRCNFTNDVSPENFLTNVIHGDKFLKGALYSFPPSETIGFFEKYGLSVKIERGNRAFPVSDHASDVTKTLEKACNRAGVDVRLNEKALKIEISNEPESTMTEKITIPHIVGITTTDNIITCDVVIIATGGLSYPSTGSTGDGYVMARACGHSVTDLKCGLCGINLVGDDFKDLQGLALKNVSISFKTGNKILYSDFGELLFTHFGISGPIVLSASSVINRADFNALEIALDLKPALDESTLDKRLLRDFDKYKNKRLGNALGELLPQKLIPFVLKKSGVSAEKPVNVFTKEERLKLIKTIKNLPLKMKNLRGFEEAIITSGGISLKEVNPKTMESKLVRGLKFCGEVLDVDAFTGGFNMQIAFSTGYIAGNSIE